MSIPIVAAPLEVTALQEMGLMCPPTIFHRLADKTQYKGVSSIKNGCVLTNASPEMLIFKIAEPGNIVNNPAGSYTYEADWTTIPILYSDIKSYKDVEKLYQLILINTKNWNKSAEIALQFVSRSLE